MSFLIPRLMLRKALKDLEGPYKFKDKDNSIIFKRYSDKSRLFDKLRLIDSFNRAKKESFNRAEEDIKNNH